MTTIGEEKRFNPRLTKTRAEFVHIMSNLKLDYPKMMGKNLLKAYMILKNDLFPSNRYSCSKKYDLWC